MKHSQSKWKKHSHLLIILPVKKSWLCKLSSEYAVTDEYWLTNSV